MSVAPMEWSGAAPGGVVNDGGCSEMVASDEEALFATDEGRIYAYKILPCPKRAAHEWAGCPYAHPGEKARRRCPRTTNYLAIPCEETKQVNMRSRDRVA
jgi:hypothetical protein